MSESNTSWCWRCDLSQNAEASACERCGGELHSAPSSRESRLPARILEIDLSGMEPEEREMFLLFLDGANIDHQIQGLLLSVSSEDEQRIKDLLETVTSDTLVDFDPTQTSTESLDWAREMASKMHPASTSVDPLLLAPIPQRVLAAVISYIAWRMLKVLLYALLTLSPEAPPYVAVLAISLLPLLGDTWLTAWNGTTPGKFVLGIRVVNVHGFAPGWRSSILRTLVMMWPVLLAYWPGPLGQLAVVITPAWFLLLVVSIARDPESQGLHDRLAGTRVVLGRHADRAVV
ncbi:MAG: hypothetical protein F2744_08980 [Actinobacteria bacterium]|nr:hypothetical protein [Actinomycetota bacterium]